MNLNQDKKVWVIGHKNPDTDSICAAITYAELKNATDDARYEAKRCGKVSEETQYVLKYFGVKEPALVSDAGAQIKDVNFRRTAGVNHHISLKRAWELMKTENVVTLPVTGDDHKLKGIIVTRDIATSYMDVYDNRILSSAKTQYRNIVETINGTILAGNEHAYFVRGKVVVATSSADAMEEFMEDDDLVILGNRADAQMRAIETNAGCIVVCSGYHVSSEVIQAANNRDCVIMNTPYDAFTVARLINQSMPIKRFMTTENLIKFEIDDLIDDVKEEMSQVRHRDFPVVDENDNYVGMISRRNLLNAPKKRLILVDHNEKSQAVDGIADAEIVEIIDHHRIGSLETMSPVYFRNQPLGCTSTIITQMYKEKNIEISKTTAGLLCAAILSDTLMFRSPTCTPYDKAVAEELAKIAEIDIETFAKNMFEAGSNFKKKTVEEIVYQDFKTFNFDDIKFGVSQISAMGRASMNAVKNDLIQYLPTVMADNKLNMAFVMLTDILEESSEVICDGTGADSIMKEAFHVEKTKDGFMLEQVVSRKKQMIPALMGALQN